MSFEFTSSSGFKVKSFAVGPLGCNCSILWDSESLEAILVDPGAEADRIQNSLESLKVKVKAIVHTHAHFDHIGASRRMHEITKAPLMLHPGDEFLWSNILMQGQMFGFETEGLPHWQTDLSHELELNLGKHKLKTLFTPGHTPGSCCFSIGEICFAGDTLFKRSIGRTDLWGGDYSQIVQSIKTRLYSLNEDTTVICGHGPETKIGIERKSNAFVTL